MRAAATKLHIEVGEERSAAKHGRPIRSDADNGKAPSKMDTNTRTPTLKEPNNAHSIETNRYCARDLFGPVRHAWHAGAGGRR